MSVLIKTLDLNDFKSSNPERTKFVKQIKEVFSGKGFCFLKNHGIAPEVLAAARKACLEFFALAEEIRLRYEYIAEKHQRGYTPFELEKAVGAEVSDYKHFLQFGVDRNIEVPDVPSFKDACSELFFQFRNNVSFPMLRATALSLGLAEDHFDTKEGNSIMRAIEYPEHANPLTGEEVTLGGNINGMCAAPHTDINVMTFLEAREEGLELWHNKKWIPVTITSPELIVVNSGDMLEHLTNGYYRSGVHRVVCRKNTHRFSIPYFCHIKENESIVPLPQFGPIKKRFRFKTSGEYLQHRLKEIGI